jgi:hypothetical protein
LRLGKIPPLYLLLTLWCLSVLLACHHRRAGALHEPDHDMEQMELTGISLGSYCAIDQSGEFVITSTREWECLWKKVHHGKYPQPEVPDVDFSRETVLAVFMGTRATGGFSIEISHLKEMEGVIKAVVKSRSPAPGELVTMAITRPFHIAKVNVACRKIGFLRE